MAVEIIDMSAADTAIVGLQVHTMKQVRDDRGTVREFYRESAYPELGQWRQVNITESGYRAIRGLHGEAMTKLVSCVSGRAFGAYLDARPESASYGAVVTVELEPGVQVLVPAGVCNGFQSVSAEGSQYLYCFTEEWRPGMAGVGYSPLDEGLGIDWPLPIEADNPAHISAKDAGAPKFSQVRVGA